MNRYSLLSAAAALLATAGFSAPMSETSSTTQITVSNGLARDCRRIRSGGSFYRGERMPFGPRAKRSAKQRNKAYACGR